MATKIFKDYNTGRYFEEKFSEIAAQPSNWEARLQSIPYQITPYYYKRLLGKKFYVSPKKYFIKEDRQDPSGFYLRVEFVEFLTKEIYDFDVVNLLRCINAIKPEQYDASRRNDFSYCCDLLTKCCLVDSKVNIDVSFREKIKPDITNVELVDAFIDIVGFGQIYFDLKEYYSYYYSCQRSIYCFRPNVILNVYSFYNHDYYYKNREFEYIPGTIYTKEDAIMEIERVFGKYIDEVLTRRDISLPILAIGLDSFNFSAQNSLICFAKSHEEDDITWRFYTHYEASWAKVSPNNTNEEIRTFLIDYIFRFFYKKRFKNRIEGSRKYNEGK